MRWADKDVATPTIATLHVSLRTRQQETQLSDGQANQPVDRGGLRFQRFASPEYEELVRPCAVSVQSLVERNYHGSSAVCCRPCRALHCLQWRVRQ